MRWKVISLIKFWNGIGDVWQEFIKMEDSSPLVLQLPNVTPSSSWTMVVEKGKGRTGYFLLLTRVQLVNCISYFYWHPVTKTKSEGYLQLQETGLSSFWAKDWKVLLLYKMEDMGIGEQYSVSVLSVQFLPYL